MPATADIPSIRDEVFLGLAVSYNPRFLGIPLVFGRSNYRSCSGIGLT